MEEKGLLQSLVVNYKPPKHFEARLVLLEQESKQLEEQGMELYLAPAETMKTYLDGMKYISIPSTARQIKRETAP